MLEDFPMHATSIEDFDIYFPAVICAEYDSPIDALIGLHIPQDEAQDLMAASWEERHGWFGRQTHRPAYAMPHLVW